VARNPSYLALAAASRASLLTVCVALGACSTLLDLDGLKRIDCVDACGADAGQASGGSSSVAGAAASSGGTSPATGGKSNGGSGVTGGKSGGGSGTTGGTSATAGTGASGGDMPSGAGAGGADETGPTGACPGGPAPPTSWQEHWSGHAEALTLRAYDECSAVYVDSAMAGTDTAWLSEFLSQAWLYNLATYGKLGAGRLFVILHLGKNIGGDACAEYETTHDGRNVIDLGANAWKPGDYDLTARWLSALVERTAVPGKQGSPASAQWGAEGFSQIYTYDLYTGLGMTGAASKALDAFSPTFESYPVPNSYWFYDFYYPLWRDHGKTKLLTNFFGLLAQYYPVTGQLMPPMNWGQYIHFLSGAAGHEAQTQATYAFGWNNTWKAQLAQAHTDFPAISY
jgi:hypothetical protein